uniref:Leucine-rich repeat extensin-like protein 3 n=1 Tax=Ascaris lumbricoides TaxID=6252 RepID=A0A0M3I954_ASCLU
MPYLCKSLCIDLRGLFLRADIAEAKVAPSGCISHRYADVTEKFTVRSKRQLCNCIAIPASQFQCSCNGPVVGGPLLQQFDLQRQLQAIQGVAQCSCAPAPILTAVVQPPPQYSCQCFPAPPLPPMIVTPPPPAIIPEVVPVPVVPPVPEPTPPPPPPPEAVPEVVPPPPPPIIVPVPTPVPIAPPPVLYPVYPRYRPGCSCIEIKISGLPRYQCDCLPPLDYYPPLYPGQLPGHYPPEAVIPPVTIPPILLPLADEAVPVPRATSNGSLTRISLRIYISATLAPIVPCSYYVTETCVCPPNYVQCGNMCCLETAKFSSQKTPRNEAKPLSVENHVEINRIGKETNEDPTAMQVFMNILNRIKTNIRKTADETKR